MALRFNTSCVSLCRRVLSTRTLLLAASFLFSFSQSAISASFTIVDGQTVTAQRTLNAGESGVIDSGGQLNVANIAITNPGGQANVTVTNNGSISTTTANDNGIQILGNTATVTNNGSITVVGNSAAGIRLSNSNNHSVSNTGSIRMSGGNGEGIVVTDISNSTISNSGIITVTGTQSRGIFALNGANNNNIYINSGTITTTGGTTSTGIGASGSNEIIINTGTITSTGNTGKGVRTTGANITTTNSGTISVTGTSGIGVELNGTNNILNNTGTIIATSNATQAIVGGGNVSTLNLQAGSKITGTIDLGGGNDTVNVTGNSTITGNVDLGAGTDTLNINGGLLTLNGTLSNAETTAINTGGTLGGNATTGSLTVSGGTLAPGNSIGTINVTGNVDFSGGGIYQAEVDAAGNSDKIIATGTATLTGGTLQITLQSGNYGSSTNYTLLTATGGITGTFSSSSDSAFLTPTLSYDANNVFLNLAVNFNNLTNQTPNQTAVGNTLTSIYSTSSSSLQTVFNSLLSLNATVGAQALDSLSGVQHTHGQRQILNLSQQFRQLLFKRTRLNSSAALAFNPLDGPLLAYQGADWPLLASAAVGSQLQAPAARGLWLQGFGSFGDIDSTSNASGADFDTKGFAFGIDTDWRDFVIGFAASYSNSDVDTFGGKTDIDSFQLAAYSSWQRNDYYFSTQLGLGYHDTEADRTITLGSSISNATADYDSYNVSANVEIGKAFPLQLTTTLTPYIGLDYTHSLRDSFSETGAGAANLSVDDNDEDSLRSRIGLRLSHAIINSQGTALTPYLTGAYVRELMDNTSRLTAAFSAAPSTTFIIDGVDTDRNRVEIGAGLTGRLTEGARFNIGYLGDIAGSDDNHSFNASVLMVW